MGEEWQKICTEALVAAVARGERQGKLDWDAFRREHPDHVNRIIIADADFSGKGMRNFDLSRCWIGRCSFKLANLNGVRFEQSIFQDCDATGASIEGASFRNADISGSRLILENISFDRSTIFEIDPEKIPLRIDKSLRNAAFRARSDRIWRARYSKSMIVRALLWITEYGLSVNRLIAASIAIIAFFTQIIHDSNVSYKMALSHSIQYFIGTTVPDDKNLALSLMASVETLTGMVMMALITSVIVSILLDKS